MHSSGMHGAIMRRLTASALALMLAAFAVVSHAAPAQAVTVLDVGAVADVDSSGACANPAIVTPVTPLTLRSAVCIANNLGGGARITLPAGTFTLTEPLTVGTRSGASVQISGASSNATVIDGAGHQVMGLDPQQVGGVSVTLTNFTIRGGVGDTYGGGAILGGSGRAGTADSLTVRGVIFDENRANVSGTATHTVGGAIQFIGGSLDIESATFRNNSSGSASGGAIAYQAMGVAPAEGLTISLTQFLGNSTGASTLVNGGAAVLIDDVSQGSAALRIHDSQFHGNASAGPGAVWVRGGALEVLRSTFLDNSASASAAGAVHVGADAVLRMRDSRLVGNTGGSTLSSPAGSRASDNWWGCPGGPGAPGCAVVAAPASVASPWLTLTATSDPVDIALGGTESRLTAGLLVNSAGAAVDASRLSAFEGVPVTWGAPHPAGTALTDSSSVLSGGAASATFQRNTAQGQGSVSVTVDHGSVQARVGLLAAPSFTSPTETAFTVGTAGSFTLRSDGFRAPAIELEGSLPHGLSFTAGTDGTATIAGTPAAGTGGVHRVEFSASNAVGDDASQVLELTVRESPSITSSAEVETTLGATINHTITTSAYPAATVTATGIPGGLSLTEVDGELTLVGSVMGHGNGGLYEIVLTASNGVGADAVQRLQLEVGEAPLITSRPANMLVTLGAEPTFSVSASGYPAPSLQWLRSTDGGETFTPIAGATGRTYSETTTEAHLDRTTVLRVTASNRAGSTSANATLTVVELPGFTSASTTVFPAQQESTFAVTTKGSPAAVITLEGGPSWLSVTSNGDGAATLRGTPPAGSGGAHTFSLVAQNSPHFEATTQRFVLEVHEAPALPADATVTVSAGAAVNIPVALARSGYPALSTLTPAGSMPAGLRLIDHGDSTGEIVGTALAGAHTVRIVATNSVGTDEQVLTIETQAAPAVTTQPGSRSVVAGQSATFSVTASGYPAPTVQWQSSSDGGTNFSNVEGATAATHTVTADQAQDGTVFRAVLSNAVGEAVSDTALLSVGTPAAFTSGTAAQFVVGSEGRHSLTASGTPAGAFALVAAPAWIRLVDNGDGTGELVGTPPVGAGGSREAEVEVSNGFGTAQRQVIALVVLEGATFTTSADATVTVGTSADVQIATRGGHPAPSLTLTGALPAGLAFAADPGAGTASITGTPEPGAGGIHSLVVTATSTSVTSTQLFTLTVHEVPTVTHAPADARVTAGSEASFTASASGYPAPAVRWQSSTDGSAFTDLVGATSGALTVTATLQSDGTLYRAVFTNAAGASYSAAATLTVGEGPVFTSAPTVSFTAGSPGSATVTASGVPSAAITAAGTLPAWLELTDNGDGTATLSGTPNAGLGGVHEVTLVAGNGYGTDATQRLLVTVLESPSLPPTVSGTFLVGSAGTLTVAVSSGYPVPFLSVVGTLPQGLTMTDHRDGTASISGIPATSSAGAHTVRLRAANDVDEPAESTVSLVVNRAVQVTSDPAPTRVVAGSEAQFSAAAEGFPAPSVQWQSSSDDGTTWANVARATSSTLTVQAAQEHDGLLVRAVFSGTGEATTAPARLTVGTPAVVTSGDSFALADGASASWRLTATGAPPAALTVTGMPQWMTFTDHGDGSGTLAAAPPRGSSGIHTVELAADNGFGAASVQSLTVMVTAAPTITSANTAGLRAGTAGSVLITTGAGTPAATTITLEGTLPGGLSFVDAGDGTATISGTPAVSTGGTHAVTVVASNGDGRVARQELTLTIAEVPAFTSAATAVFTRGIDGEFIVSTRGGHPSIVSLSVVGILPAGLSFADRGDGTGIVRGTLLRAPGDAVSVTLRASNASGSSEQVLSLETRAVGASALPIMRPVPHAAVLGVPATAVPGDSITVSGTGFAPYSPVTLGMYSVPVHLDTVTADAAGSFTARVTLPSDLTGRHSIVAIGTAPDGSPRSLVTEIELAAAPAAVPPPRSGLPVTGAEGAGDWGAAALGAALLGLLLMLRAKAAVRRRASRAYAFACFE